MGSGGDDCAQILFDGSRTPASDGHGLFERQTTEDGEAGAADAKRVRAEATLQAGVRGHAAHHVLDDLRAQSFGSVVEEEWLV